MSIKIKQHDTKGKFIDTLMIDGEPVDLTDCVVSFMIKNSKFAIKKDAVITYPLDQSDPDKRGKVEYQQLAGDVANKGVFNQEWEVVFPDTEILTFPNGKYNAVEILADLG